MRATANFNNRTYWATSLTLCVWMLLAAINTPTAVATAVNFQMPFACGETWFASTYSGHRPSEYSIDWNLSSQEDAGKPVYSGVSGTATVRAHQAPGYGNYVDVAVKNAPGWTARYAHLNVVFVGNGQIVSPQTQIGTVGTSGLAATAYHLHYEQLFNGVAQPITVDGIAVQYRYSLPGNAYTSANCGSEGSLAPGRGGGNIASWEPGRLDVFTKGSAGSLMHKWFDGNWSEWEDLGGSIQSEPAAVSWGPGRIDVFAQGLSDRLIHKFFTSSTGWSAWEDLGGCLSAAPTVSSWASGRLDIFVRGCGAGENIYHRYYQGGWSAWEAMGGYVVGPLAAVSWGNGRIDLFGRGTDNQLYRKFWASTKWSAWESLGGCLSAGPGVSSWGPGRIDVFVKGCGAGENVWHKSLEANSWSMWEAMGGQLASKPASVSWEFGRIDIFGYGVDAGTSLFHRFYHKGWSTWEGLGLRP